jgi:hypothetical protein
MAPFSSHLGAAFHLYVGYSEVSDLVADLGRRNPSWTSRDLHNSLLSHGSPAARHLRSLVLSRNAVAVGPSRTDPAVGARAACGRGPHRSATRDGVALDLSVNEFAVLEALMRAAPSPLSAEDLLESVWDAHADPFTKTVYVTIGRLRRKLGAPGIIETIPRVGYRIRPPTEESASHT